MLFTPKSQKKSEPKSAPKAEKPPPDDEPEEKHGGEQDGEQADKEAAGQDLLDAIQSGDAMEVFHAHQHLHNIHMSSEDPASSEKGESGKTSLVAALRGMKPKE